jgi:hypothetical protein
MKKKLISKCKRCGKNLSIFNKTGKCFSHVESSIMKMDRITAEEMLAIKRRWGIVEDPIEALFNFLNIQEEVPDGRKKRGRKLQEGDGNFAVSKPKKELRVSKLSRNNLHKAHRLSKQPI